ncbi:MAG: hypothetical protein ICV83_13910 [Cytophagales bacterium]|nr:hypothetical protein [Cytophagales bacterium]
MFRTHYSRIVAVLSRHFGLEHLETAEDLATEAFVAALQSWPYHGIPQNPVAWHCGVAKNKAKLRSWRGQNRSLEIPSCT